MFTTLLTKGFLFFWTVRWKSFQRINTELFLMLQLYWALLCPSSLWCSCHTNEVMCCPVGLVTFYCWLIHVPNIENAGKVRSARISKCHLVHACFLLVFQQKLPSFLLKTNKKVRARQVSSTDSRWDRLRFGGVLCVLFLFCLIICLLPTQGFDTSLAFSFMGRSTCWGFYCMYIWFASPRGEASFLSSLPALCFSCCSFLPVYSNIYLSCFIVSPGYRNMRLLLGCWKSSFQNPSIKCFASGCYNILRILHHIISQKPYYLLWRLVSTGWIMLLCLLMF